MAHLHLLASAPGTPPPVPEGPPAGIYCRRMPTPADVLTERLAFYIGPHTARVAVKTFCQSALSLEPAQLEAADVARLLPALRPMLRTLLGSARAEEIVFALAEEFR